MRITVSSILFLATFLAFGQYGEDRASYFMIGVGGSIGFLSRDYNDGLFNTRNRKPSFNPTIVNLRFGSPISNRAAIFGNAQLGRFNQQSGDIISNFINTQLTIGGSFLLENEKVYLLLKSGLSVLNRSLGINLSPGVGFVLNPKLNLEVETSLNTYGRYNFTNYTLTDLRVMLHYTFGE